MHRCPPQASCFSFRLCMHRPRSVAACMVILYWGGRRISHDASLCDTNRTLAVLFSLSRHIGSIASVSRKRKSTQPGTRANNIVYERHREILKCGVLNKVHVLACMHEA